MFINVFEFHEQAWFDLQRRRERLPHALLLIGQQGLGKFQLAEAFVKSLLCEAPLDGGHACGACLACRWLEQGNHPDFRLLQPEAFAVEGDAEEGKKKASQQITIEQVRNLDEFLGVGSHRGGLSIVLVNPAETLNRNAANAILKTLEEPPANTLFILVSSEPNRLLPTIRSRCQVISVPTPAHAIAAKVMERSGIANAPRWLALAGGAPRIAAELAESGQGAWLDTISKRLVAGEKNDPLLAAAEVEKLLKESKGRLQLRQVVETLLKWLVDLNLVKNGQKVRYFLDQQSQLDALAAMIPDVRMLRLYRTMCRRRVEAEQPLNPRLFLETLFMDYRALFGR